MIIERLMYFVDHKLVSSSIIQTIEQQLIKDKKDNVYGGISNKNI